MKILGIDPGYDRIGVAILEKKPNLKKETVIYSDCIQTDSKDTIYERYKMLGNSLSQLIDEYKPDSLAIENLFITKNQKTAMRVSEARGIIIYEAARRNIPIYEYSPVEIKLAVSGDGASDKRRIIKMVHLLVDLAHEERLDDEYDAIAVALTHSARTRT